MHKGELLHPQDQFQNIVSKYSSQYYKNGGGETFRTIRNGRKMDPIQENMKRQFFLTNYD